MEMDHLPHVLIFPIPLQGHINSMIKLAELLALTGFNLTFLNSHHNHERLLKLTNIAAHFERYPGFQFKTITDGVPLDHPRSGNWFMEMYEKSIEMNMKQSLKEMLLNINPPVDCIIGDGFLGFAIDVANELGIPIICFRTSSPCGFWAYYSIPDIIQAGELPIKGSEDMDRLITTVPGMETYLRCRDLPSFCRTANIEDSNIQLVAKQTRKSLQADALIFNTTEELDGPILSQIRTKCPRVYAIGPLNAQLNTRLNAKYGESYARFSNTLLEEDKSCISWLDKQPNRSVIYVSFGSITSTSRDQLIELWHGLVHSKAKFLVVVRPNSVIGKDGEGEDVVTELMEKSKDRSYIVDWAPQEAVLNHLAVGGFLTHSGWNSTLESIIPGVPMICWPYFADQQVNSRHVSEVWKIGLDMMEKSKDRSYIVDWAPQEAVLNHPAVGGFLTHSGWNSTLESIIAGVPMICWPYFADQQVNSRHVSEVWKIGLDMKDVCDRKIVEKMVNDVMVDRKEEFAKSAGEMAKAINESVSFGGSSYCNLDRLIEDIRTMSLKTPRKMTVS